MDVLFTGLLIIVGSVALALALGIVCEGLYRMEYAETPRGRTLAIRVYVLGVIIACAGAGTLAAAVSF